jgi:hypothetical protein
MENNRIHAIRAWLGDKVDKILLLCLAVNLIFLMVTIYIAYKGKYSNEHIFLLFCVLTLISGTIYFAWNSVRFR